VVGRRIDNPTLNSPFEMPNRHFRFDDEGITDEVVEGRRPSSYFMPIPASRKRIGPQEELICDGSAARFGDRSGQSVSDCRHVEDSCANV
jgi:hypothetical protein